MIKRIIVTIMLLALLMPSVMGIKLIPIEYNVAYENYYNVLNAQRTTTIMLPNGYRQTIVWPNSTSSPAASSFSAKLYYELDEDVWCEQNSNIGEYKNISLRLTDMLRVCQLSVESLNNKSDIEVEYRDAVKNYSKYFELYNDCAENYDEAKTYKSSYESCESAKSSLVAERNELKKIEQEYEDALKDKNTYALGGIAAGLLVGWFLWKRKGGSGPSEHQEAGTTNDYDGMRFGPYKDGPLE